MCTRCGGGLERTGGGFFHGIVPDPRELLIYALTIATAFAVAATVARVR